MGSEAETKAALAAGYKNGTSISKNAHKWALQADIKARVRELRMPAIQRAEEQAAASTEWAISRLRSIADAPDIEPKASDQISAIALIAKLMGWLGPERFEHSGPDGRPIASAVLTADVSDLERARALADFLARMRASTPQAA